MRCFLFVISHFPMINIKSYQLDKLQHALNAAARVLSRSNKFDHISPVLQHLHWLLVQELIEFKILLLTWKIVLGFAPGYLCDLITPHVPQRNLRSSHKNLLLTLRTQTAYGSRAYHRQHQCCGTTSQMILEHWTQLKHLNQKKHQCRVKGKSIVHSRHDYTTQTKCQ